MSMFGNAALFSNNFGDTTPPAKPSLSTVDITDTSIIISGSSTDNIGITEYDVYIDAVLYDTITGASFTGYSIGGLASETNYDIYIIAKDLKGNESVPSDMINFTTDVFIPPLDIIVPTWSGNNLSYTAVTSTGVTLNWTAATDNVGVTGYSIYKDNNLLLNVGNVLTYNVTGLTIFTTYGFKLKATDAAGNVSDFSNTVTFTTVDSIAPSKPVLSYHTLTGTSVMINGSASDNVGVVEYDVYLDGVFNKTIVSSYFTNEVITGLDDVTGYSIYITAKDAAGNESVASDAVTFTTLDATDPSKPTLTYANVTYNSVEISGTSTDNVAVTYYKVYVDEVFSENVNGASLSSYVVDGLTGSTNYDIFIVAVDAAGNESLPSDIINFTTSAAPVIGAKPVLSNFRIDNAQPSRVYFDANTDVTGLTSDGFIISGKTISGNPTIDGDGLGGYFTVSVPFTFWDNNTIRLEGADGTVYDFTLEHIVNNINEPAISATTYFVNSAVGSSGNGLTEATAKKTIAEAVSLISGTGGCVIYVKAGSYPITTNINLENKHGTVSTPIRIIGYKTDYTANGGNGDITTNYYVWNEGSQPAFNSAEMPLINASNLNIQGFRGYNASHFIFKNLQFSGLGYGIRMSQNGDNYAIIDNCNFKDNNSDLSTAYTGVGVYVGNDGNSNSKTNSYCRILNSNFVNNSTEHIGVFGNYNLVENCKTYCNNTTSNFYGTDYYIRLCGSNNIVKNSRAVRQTSSVQHDGHGIGIKSGETSTFAASNYNLIVECYSKGILENYYARNKYADYNVFKRSEADGFGGVSSGEDSDGINFMTGASYNIAEYMNIHHQEHGVVWVNGTEVAADDSNTRNNIVRNSIIYDNLYAMSVYNSDSAATLFTDNKLTFCTIYNGGSFYQSSGTFTNTNFEISNNIISETTPVGNTMTGFVFDYNNFYNSWTTGIGANDTNVNPNFVNLIDFVPQTIMPAPLIVGAYYDYNESERAATTTIGAVKHGTEQVIEVDPPVGYTPDYYVSSTTGNDSNDGLTEQTAWATMSKVSSSNVADKVVAFKGGDTFTGTITKNYLGTQNTIYTSYGTGKAKIIGYEPITGWTQESTNLWYASTVGKTIYHVMIGEDLQTNARIPKISSDYAMQGNYYDITSVSSSSIFIATSLIGSADLVGAYCYVKSYMDTLIKRTITAFNPTTGQVTLDSAVTAMSSDDIFFVNNHKNITTVAGDWYYDAGNNRLYIYSTTSPTNINAITKADRPFFFEGSSAITFDNIEFNGLYLGAMYFESGSSYVVQNCSFKNIHESPIHSNFGVTTATISDNVFENLNSAAVNMYSTNINTTITGNTINNIGLLSNLSYLGYSSSTSQGTGLALYKGSASGNTITNCGYNGIAAYGGGTVENNIIEDVCLSGTDGAGIYTYEHATYGSIGIIQNNIIINNNSLDGTYLWQSMGIYCDQSSQDVQVLNNTVTNFYHNIFMNHGARNSFTGNNLYKSYREPVLMKLLDGFVLVNESNTLTYNEVYSDSNTYDCIKHYNEKDATLGWVSYDYNKYFNPQLSTSVYVIASGLTAHDTLAQWQTRTSEDANSIDDSAETITGSHLAYNATGASASISLPTGTWRGLDGTGSYTGTITLDAYTGKILIK